MKKICILSAHQGADYWLKLVKFLNTRKVVQLTSLHAFDDSRYRASGSLNIFMLRLQIYFFYPIRCLKIILWQKSNYDYYLVVTSPFFLPALCSLISTKPVITLQNDLYPEALVKARIIKSRGPIYRLLLELARGAVRRSFAIVYICESHLKFAEKHLGVKALTKVIPVGADGSNFKSHPPLIHHGPTRILYCGTLGHMHDPSTILDCLSRTEVPQDIDFSFHTSGAGKVDFELKLKEIEKGPNSARVNWGDALSYDDWLELMVSSPVGLVFQSSGAENVVFPSKVFGQLVAGQAILAIASIDCELGQLISSKDCGWVIAPGNTGGLASVFLEILTPEILLRKRSNSFALGHGHYDISQLANSWEELLAS